MSNTRYTTIDELPLSLTVSDIQNILGIGRRQAYELCSSEEFPHLRIGARVIIPKPAFLKWFQVAAK